MASKSSTAAVSPINNSSFDRINENVDPIINDWDSDPLNLFFRIFASEKGLNVCCKVEVFLCGAVETNEARFLEVAFRALDISPIKIILSVAISICACG